MNDEIGVEVITLHMTYPSEIRAEGDVWKCPFCPFEGLITTGPLGDKNMTVLVPGTPGIGHCGMDIRPVSSPN